MSRQRTQFSPSSCLKTFSSRTRRRFLEPHQTTSLYEGLWSPHDINIIALLFDALGLRSATLGLEPIEAFPLDTIASSPVGSMCVLGHGPPYHGRFSRRFRQ